MKHSREHKYPTKYFNKFKVGDILGIQDKNGEWLKVGDRIKMAHYYYGLDTIVSGIILPVGRRLCFLPDYSRWYGDDIYNSKSYGKAVDIRLDDGMRMDLEKIKE